LIQSLINAAKQESYPYHQELKGDPAEQPTAKELVDQLSALPEFTYIPPASHSQDTATKFATSSGHSNDTRTEDDV
jgi:hypothetical protein